MKLQRTAENLLIAANIFILFILLFYGRLQLPGWVQVAGRMHPLLLHFPIVLLLMAVLLDLTMLRNAKLRQFQPLVTGMWLAGALAAAITAIAGLLLAKEEGYENIGLHKWSGLAIVWVASLSYRLRYARQLLFWTGNLAMLAALVIAGHAGANLTHGEDFLLAPVARPAEDVAVPFDEALAYEHLVRPILREKCMSCHNSSKTKGELNMETVALLRKGGKSGALFLAGDPAASLLMQRIHLPVDEKKHMPPKKEPQLDDEEIAILRHWIAKGGSFELALASLPASDSLRTLAQRRLSAPGKEETFDFAAASADKIAALTSNYRVIYPLSRNSPALVVTFYNRDQYKPEDLEALLPLKTQIVELHLQKMPVKDAALATIARFPNLRKINLDYTDITGQTLGALKSLSHLQSLAVSGTAVTLPQLQQLSGHPSLREVYCWNTRLQPKDSAALAGIRGIRFERGFTPGERDTLKLNAPIIANETPVFRDNEMLVLRHPIRGAEIRYTLDGSEVDSLTSPVYTGPLRLDSSCIVRAKAFKAGWYGSDAAKARFMKTSYQPDSALFLQLPNDKYTGNGAATLWDRETGNFEIASGKWLGFRYNPMEMMFMFRQPVHLREVTLNTMQLTRSYIFPPAVLEVWGGESPDKMRLLRKLHPAQPGKDTRDTLQCLRCTFAPSELQCLKIVAIPVEKLPGWHDGRGQKAWIFVDEVLFN
ncbi:c-type cytochrome domain-containing protein [Chitinophaga lutea]